MMEGKTGPLIMGVINVTPDSFSDGGQFANPEKAVKRALTLLEEGADILDIGGESTRPGAQPVRPEQEQARILPVIQDIRTKAPAAIISVDTRHGETMEKAIEAGAHMVNDISALTHDSKALAIVAAARVPVVLMHMQGTPDTMQQKPVYDDVVEEVLSYLQGRIRGCESAGIKRDNIIIDPGIGFGKTLVDNLDLLNHLDRFHDLGCSLLLGVSRKSFIEKICPGTTVDQRLPGSLAAALQGLEQGVNIFRVHDVRETRQAFAVWQAIKNKGAKVVKV